MYFNNIILSDSLNRLPITWYLLPHQTGRDGIELKYNHNIIFLDGCVVNKLLTNAINEPKTITDLPDLNGESMIKWIENVTKNMIVFKLSEDIHKLILN